MSEAVTVTQCELCNEGFEPDRPEQRLCDVCLGRVVKYPLSVVTDGYQDPVGYERLPDVEIRNCSECGEEFSEWKQGPFMQRKKCRKCLSAKRVASVKAVWAKNGGKKKGGRKPMQQNEVKPKEQATTITIDFANYPWALAWLVEQNPGIDLGETLLREVCHSVPPEWVKGYLMGDFSA